jgi:NitT/TauT family transport system substrate-binding protein
LLFLEVKAQKEYAMKKEGVVVTVFLAWLGLNIGAVEAAQRKITVGYASLGVQMAGVWMAKEIGAFDKYGLDADVIFISSGPVVISALVGGDLTVGVGASNAAIAATLQGAPLISVLSTGNRPYHNLWVQPEISKLEDLRGKFLGVTRFGAVTDNLTRILLKKNGLDGAVKVRQLGGMQEVGAAFQQKIIAGAVTSGLRVKVPTKLLVRLIDMKIPYSMNLGAVSRDYYKKNPDTVERFVRAYVEGVAALNQQKPRALAALAKYTRLSDPKMVQDMYDEDLYSLEKIPRVEPDAVNTILDFMGKSGAPLESFADNSIVDKMAGEGFFARLYKNP